MPHRWRVLLLFAISEANSTYSYQQAWPREFSRHRTFDVTPLNLADRSFGARIQARFAIRNWRGDVIVILHSVFSNEQYLLGHTLQAIARRPEPKVFFIGNEYKSMPEKMAFCQDLGLALLVSQSSSPAVHAEYKCRLGCAVTGIPNTGVDPTVFAPKRAIDERPVDVGYRAMASPRYLGHAEREEIASYFQENAQRLGLNVDISLAPEHRFDEAAWADFLNRCKGQLGTEAGGDYFELTDKTRRAVLAYERAHPDASLADIRTRFFDGRAPGPPMRIMSGRIVEAAATRTVQILFDGHYDGYFQPDEHFIPLKKDFSNIDEAICGFKDRSYAEKIANNAYELAMAELTYDRLLDRFAKQLHETVGSPAATR
jgi:hypothetical protein